MQTIGLILLYLKRIISYHIIGRSASLNDIVHLEEGFYHDLKSLFNKRIGLPISKFKAGNSDSLIEQDIRSGAADVIKLIMEVRRELFFIVPPRWRMIAFYKDVYQLRQALENGTIGEVVGIFERLKNKTTEYYDYEIKHFNFDLESLLDQLYSSHKSHLASVGKNIDVSFERVGALKPILLPYVEYNRWRQVLDGFITNAIEAVQNAGKRGMVKIEYSQMNKKLALLRIIDNGVGMNPETLSRFSAKGFSRGKPLGQGLGISEEAMTFINSRGSITVASVITKGTTVAIEIDSAKASGQKLFIGDFHPAVNRKSRAAMITFILIIASYLLFSMRFEDLRFWTAQQIFGYRLINPSSKNPKHYFHGIAALDRDNSIIWEKSLGPPAYIINDDPILHTGPFVKDLNQDDQTELLITLRPGTGENYVVSDSLVCFAKDKRELWRIGLGLDKPRALFDLAKGAEGRSMARFVGVFDLPKPAMPVIVVCAACVYYPTQVMLLNGKGMKLGEYWHAGHVDAFGKPWDMDDDGRAEFIFYGINNRLGWSPAIMMIELDEFAGQSPPYVDNLLKPAQEDIYYIFGHAWIGDYGGYVAVNPDSAQLYAPLNTVMIYGASYKPVMGTGGVEYYYDFSTEDGRTIRLDENFDLDTIIVDTIEFDRWWEQRQKALKVTRHWNDLDIKQLYGYKKFIRGDLKIDSITVSPEKYDFKKYWAQLLR